MSLLFYLVIMIFEIAYAGSSMEIVTVLKSLVESISSNPTEKDKLNAMLQALENQTNLLANNAEIQKNNILFFSMLLDQVLFETMWYENHKKNFIDVKIYNIELEYNVLRKNILNTIDIAKNSKIVDLVKIFIAFVHDGYQEYFHLSRAYQEVLMGMKINNKKKLPMAFSENPMYEMNRIKDIVNSFDDEHNSLQARIVMSEEKMKNDFLHLIRTISEKIKYLIEIEKNKDISDNETKFYDFTIIKDQLKDLIFASVNEKKQIIDQSDEILLSLEFCLKKIVKKLLVIENTFMKEVNRQSYTIKDFTAELLAKSMVLYETKKKNKNKFFNNLQFQDNRFLKLLKKSKGFIGRYHQDISSQNNRIKKDSFDIIMNSFSNLISLYQSYALGLIEQLNNLKSFFNSIANFNQWKEKVFQKFLMHNHEKKTAALLPIDSSVENNTSFNKVSYEIKRVSDGIGIEHKRIHRKKKHTKKK